MGTARWGSSEEVLISRADACQWRVKLQVLGRLSGVFFLTFTGTHWCLLEVDMAFQQAASRLVGMLMLNDIYLWAYMATNSSCGYGCGLVSGQHLWRSRRLPCSYVRSVLWCKERGMFWLYHIHAPSSRRSLPMLGQIRRYSLPGPMVATSYSLWLSY